MNKRNSNFFLWYLGILCSASVTISCNSESGGSNKDLHLAARDTIVRQYNADRPDWDQADWSEGKANMIVKEGRIVIEYEADNSTELAYYFFQTDDNDQGLKSDSLGRAEVIFMERNMVINSLQRKKTFLFTIDKGHEPAYLKELDGAKVYYGYGLGARKVIKGSPLENVPYCACDLASTPPGNCKAGGVLNLNCATANENGSCRVACSGQTYACCDRGFE
jgi:hypothetical protein